MTDELDRTLGEDELDLGLERPHQGASDQAKPAPKRRGRRRPKPPPAVDVAAAAVPGVVARTMHGGPARALTAAASRAVDALDGTADMGDLVVVAVPEGNLADLVERLEAAGIPFADGVRPGV